MRSSQPAPCPLPSTLPVAGVSRTQHIVRGLSPGQELYAVRDDGNAYDPNAVMFVLPDGSLVGYVPRVLNRRLRARAEAAWRCRVSEVLPGETWGLRVTVLPGQPEETPEPRSPLFADTAPPAPPHDPPAVTTRGGRPLGVLDSRQGGLVHVRRPDGTTAAYPESSVRVSADQPRPQRPDAAVSSPLPR
ncbi:HIRAN domain-containing protein [Bailinhaonella thermotolerans]|nr:HIRAN domain-containing protein [Bailinhaonella thermotolerans]